MVVPLPDSQSTETIADRIQKIREHIQAAAQRVGRDPSSIRLIAASKTVPAKRVMQAYEAGIRDFGENRLQEAQEKMGQIGQPEGLVWHFIGRMQRRKLKAIVGNFTMLHSVENLEQAQNIDALAAQRGIQQPILLEVNIGGETSKGGFPTTDLQKNLPQLDRLPNLAIQGLMTIPPATSDPEGARPYFTELASLKANLSRSSWGRIHLKELSMGMSHDYEVAVEEGATLVRIGSAIFGPRP